MTSASRHTHTVTHRRDVADERRLGLTILEPRRVRIVAGAGYWHVSSGDGRWNGEAPTWRDAVELAEAYTG